MTNENHLCILGNMKQIILLFTLTMFLANSFIVSAWADPCALEASDNHFIEMVSDTQDSIMPCHDAQHAPEELDNHCDGLCLCMHTSIHQIPVLNEVVTMSNYILQDTRLLVSNEFGSSTILAPPFTPPKS